MEGGADAPAVWQLTQATDSTTMRVAWAGVASKRILGALARTQQRRQKLDTHTQRARGVRARAARTWRACGYCTIRRVRGMVLELLRYWYYTSDPAEVRARPRGLSNLGISSLVPGNGGVVRVSTEIAIHTAIWYMYAQPY
eukprot:COSAG02_NODE_27366_length_611_cov_1.242188_1_plen_141_part_00